MKTTRDKIAKGRERCGWQSERLWYSDMRSSQLALYSCSLWRLGCACVESMQWAEQRIKNRLKAGRHWRCIWHHDCLNLVQLIDIWSGLYTPIPRTYQSETTSGSDKCVTVSSVVRILITSNLRLLSRESKLIWEMNIQYLFAFFILSFFFYFSL